MSAGKILWGQVLAVLGTALAFVWAATEWVAWRLAFQPELGRPWLRVLGWPLYDPFSFFWWWFAFDAYARGVFTEGAYIAAFGGVMAAFVAISLSVARAREVKRAQTYGSARWAGRREVARAGLFGEDGVVLGRFAGRYLRHAGPEHILCFAPTRSGKGVGLVVPTLLTWSGSCIVHDIKGENWNLTAGWRARFGEVLLFDPTNPASSPYNPLLEIRKGQWEVRDVQNVADILVDPEGSLEKRNHWEKTSHALLVGAILHVLYAEPDKTLAGVAAFLSDPRRSIEATLAAMMSTPHLGEAGVHPVVAQAARELLNKSENERSGVLSTAMSFLGLYRDPVVAKVTGSSAWRIADLVEGPAPVSLYLVIPPSDLSRARPLVRLILNQIGRRLTEDLTPAADRRKLLIMFDEFASEGRLDFFESDLAFMAGYGVRAFLIAQSLNQIEKAYGPNNAILDNCHVRVAFASNDERTARRISDSLGTMTEQRAMKNYAGHRLSPWLGHLMISRTETSRPLLTPGEVMQLPADQEIVMLGGLPPIRATKARYYADPRFRARVLPPPSQTGAEARQEAKDDWSGLAAIPAAPPPRPQAGKGRAAARVASGSDAANAGVRREPGLPAHEEITAEPARPAQPEFEFDESLDQEEAARNQRMRDRFLQTGRQAALDPGDGMDS
jgi:type IV secretion system protein VirD4